MSLVHSAGASETVLYGYAPIEQILNNTKNLLAFLNKIIYNIPRHLIYGELSELVEGARLEIV